MLVGYFGGLVEQEQTDQNDDQGVAKSCKPDDLFVSLVILRYQGHVVVHAELARLRNGKE